MDRQMLFVKCSACGALILTNIHADEVEENADMSGSHVCEHCGMRVNWKKNDVEKEGITTWKTFPVAVNTGKANDK